MMFKIKYNKAVIKFILLTFPFMSSTFCDQYIVLDLLFISGKVMASLYIIAYFIIIKKKVSLAAVMIITIEMFLLFTTVVNHAELRRCVMTVLQIAMVSLLFDMGLDSAKEFIVAQYFCFSIIIYLNFVCELMFPDGMFVAKVTNYTQNWILGYYNNHSVYYIMAICMTLLYMHYYNKIIGPVLLLSIIGVSALLVRSGGVIGTLGIMYSFLIIFLVCKKLVGNYYIYWMIHVVFFCAIFLGRRALLNIAYIFAESLFSKGSSFLARVALWIREVTYLKDNWLIGYGIESQTARLKEYGWALHTHNLVLEILHQGGIIYFALFSFIVIYAGYKLNLCKDIFVVRIVSICFLGWIVATLVEPFTTPFLIALFIVAERVMEIDEFENLKLEKADGENS